MTRRRGFRWLIALCIILAASGLCAAGLSRLAFSTDMLATLPQNDPVLADGRYVLMHNPALEKIVIDIGTPREDAALLQESAAFVEERLRASGMFSQVGLEHMARLMPGLVQYAAENLAVLFTGQELHDTVAPLLAPENVRAALASRLANLQTLSGIGQAGFLAADPLELRNLVLGRLANLIPVQNARLEKGRLLSADRLHCLIIAEPTRAGTNTAFARRLTRFFTQLDGDVQARFGAANPVTLTPVGAFRTALDNEDSAKRTVEAATLFSTVAVALLLLVAFPRPLVGLLALVPALAGTMLAVFVYSLFTRTVSLLSVGFGGAIISFTVDYGIAYLLFLDQRHETKGFEASRQVWSLGLIAMLTTAASFAALAFSGFPALAEIGLFSSLGVVFTYIFVHLIFPLVFSRMPAAGRGPLVPLDGVVKRITAGSHSVKLYTALAFCAVMLFFCRPVFLVDPTSLNAATPQTRAAEKLVQTVWGDVTGSMQLMLEAATRDSLGRQADKLSNLLRDEVAGGGLQPCFLPSGLAPGPEQAASNFAAWKKFWSAQRVAELEAFVNTTAGDLGFAPAAFAPFFARLRSTSMPAAGMPEELLPLVGITKDSRSNTWRQVLSLAPGPKPAPAAVYERLTDGGIARLFDPGLFNAWLGNVLQAGFLKMALIVGVVTLLVALFYFADWQLALLGMAPTVFALICTLGTLRLMGQPLGIPTLMVAVVVIGMGTDYGLYFIRAWQRYFDEDNASLGLIRLAVFLSFATTFLGFGVLALCDNPMLKSAGLGLALGIGYSFIGAAAIVPPVLNRLFTPAAITHEAVATGSAGHFKKFLAAYRHMESYPRMFARFKVLCDPMFPRLAEFLPAPRTVIDIGTGYGVPAVWLLALYPDLRVYGIEPDERRARFASRAIGGRGTVTVGSAPDVPATPEPADAALLLDMLHHLTDDEARLTLARLHGQMQPGARLIVRVTVPLRSRASVQRFVEAARLKLLGIAAYFRPAAEMRDLITAAGFTLQVEEPVSPGSEIVWFIAEKQEGIHHRDTESAE